MHAQFNFFLADLYLAGVRTCKITNVHPIPTIKFKDVLRRLEAKILDVLTKEKNAQKTQAAGLELEILI